MAPVIYASKIEIENGLGVWFKSIISEPTGLEMKGWVSLYREEALSRGPDAPLIVDVEKDGLRRHGS